MIYCARAFDPIHSSELLKNYNVATDYVSLILIIWNWACVGLICIHWKGPLLLQQVFEQNMPGCWHNVRTYIFRNIMSDSKKNGHNVYFIRSIKNQQKKINEGFGDF